MDCETGPYSELGALVGGFAHEIRNPLSTISLNLKLLAGDVEGGEGPREERARRRIRLLQDEVERLQNLLDAFLRIARPPCLKKEPGDLNRVLRETADFVEPELNRRGIQLRLFCSDALPLVPMDAGQLRQALLNLLLNAQHALEEKGGGEILLASRQQGERALITVLDNGPGMPPEVLGRCWKPWYSTRPGGSGLGLPTARRIVLDHGGSIRVQTEPGRGTQFLIELPLAAERRMREGQA